MISVAEAQEYISKQVLKPELEPAYLEEALGRVLGVEVYADRDLPPFNRAAVDGYAIKYKDFAGGCNDFKVKGTVLAGQYTTLDLASGECIKVMTGAPVPFTVDTMIKVEDVSESGDNISLTIQEIKQGQNIAKQGEDSLKGNVIIAKGTCLNASHIAVLAATGYHKVQVVKTPKIIVISTGDEIIDPASTPSFSQIRDSNSYALCAFLKAYHIVPKRYLINDEPQKLRMIIENVDADVIIISGGVSMGDADFVPDILANIGFDKIFHKVALKPGKPLWFGRSIKSVVFALPGNPISVQFSFKLFIEPFLRKSLSLPPLSPLLLPLKGDRKKKSKLDEFFPARLINTDKTYVEQVRSNGSGDITATVLSHGIAHHPAEVSELGSGDFLAFYQW